MTINREGVSFCSMGSSYTLSTCKAYYDLVNLLSDCDMLPAESDPEFIDFLHGIHDHDGTVFFCLNWKVVMYCDVVTGDVLDVCDIDDILPEARRVYEDELNF